VDRQEFGKSRHCAFYDTGIIQEYAWKDWGNPRRTSARFDTKSKSLPLRHSVTQASAWPYSTISASNSIPFSALFIKTLNCDSRFFYYSANENGFVNLSALLFII
jgi:hypothetical protein